MKFCLLRSGSSGNCTLVEHAGRRVLLDAGGMSQKRLGAVLDEVGLTPADIEGLVVSHLHSDHLNYSALCVCRKNGIPVWVNGANTAALRRLYESKLLSGICVREFRDEPFEVGAVRFRPFGVSHDAPECTSGFQLAPADNPETFVAYAADLGFFPDPLVENFAGARHVVLEANHDPALLWNNPFRPVHHKERVAGNKGHLSNQQSGDALVKVFRAAGRVSDVVLCHLSNDHNSPSMAVDVVSGILAADGLFPRICAAERRSRTAFFEV